MPDLVLDSHALVWYLLESPQLSRSAHAAIKDAIGTGSNLLVPVISLAEVMCAEERGRVPHGVMRRIWQEMGLENPVVRALPLTPGIVQKIASVPYTEVPDLHDRIIAATALELGLPLVTADGRLRAASVSTIW